MKLRLHAEFASDVEYITFELSQARPGWDARFEAEVRRILALLRDNPRLYQRVPDLVGPYRRAPLAGFPHLVIYAVLDEEVVVLSCFDPARRPLAWLDRAAEFDGT